MWDASQTALIREAAISGRSLSAGLAAMGKANYANLGLHGECVFSVALGFERLLKIICLLDALIGSNRFPTDKELKGFGHDIEDLYEKAHEIRLRHKVKSECAIEPGSIEHDLFRFVARFAGSTMYYNLSYFAADGPAGKGADPVAGWFDDVARQVLEAHLTPRRRAKMAHRPELVDQLVACFSACDFSGPDTPSEAIAAARADLNKLLQQHVPFYCARICRYLYEILQKVTREAQTSVSYVEVPSLDGLFFPFATADERLMARKTFPASA